MDYTHPLPLSNLISRFQPSFDALNLGLSVHLERLPHSGVSSLLQYLVSNPEVSQKLTKRKLIYLHPDNLTVLNTSNLLREILRQFTGHPEKITDEFFLLNKIKQDKLPKIIIIDWSSRWTELDETAKFAINSLYESGVTHQNLSLLIITPPNQTLTLFSKTEKSFNFSLFTDKETEYSINRFLVLYQQKLSPPQIKDIVQNSSGLAGLIKPLIELSFTNKNVFSHSKIQIILNDLQKYQHQIPPKTYLSQILNIYSPPEKVGNLTFTASLSHQDLLLIQRFQNFPNQIISRDQIATVIWEKQAVSKYSDWAIDKAISRLRRKLSPASNYKIITVKNSGYKLVSF